MPAQSRPLIPPAERHAATRVSLWMILLILCAPAAGAVPLPYPHHRQPKQIVHSIEKLEQRWQQAALHADTAVMSTMLAEDYLGISGDGTLATKAETLAAFRSGTIRFSKIDISDLKIRVFGPTVVVVSRARVAGANNGEDISGHYRYTRVYHRINGTWQIVSFEASSIHEHQH